MMGINSENNLDELQIAVVGAGSWGTAIADLLASKGYRISLWVYEKEVKDQIKESRENKLFFAGS